MKKTIITLYKEDFSEFGWKIYCEQLGVPQDTRVIDIEVNVFKVVK